MNRYTIIPSNILYKGAPSVDQEISVTLEGQNQEITEYDRSSTVNLDQPSRLPIYTIILILAQQDTYHFNITYITQLQSPQKVAEYGEDFLSITSSIFTDQVYLTNIFNINQKVRTHIIGCII
jgi:chemotaxis protein histidine kinase CheA